MRFATRTKKWLLVFFLTGTVGLVAADAGDHGAVVEVELSDPVSPELPPRVHRVTQYSEENGFPAGYALSFTTHVCMDEQCRMVKLTMYWDALGRYQRLEYPPATPLTKRKHVPFAAADYAKLDRILKDPDSILGSVPLDVLAPRSEAVEVDGWSGATPQTVKDSVVDEAAYTSWAMWRWANGEIVRKLRDLTEQRCTPEFVRHLLRSADRREVDFALRYVQRHCPSDARFVDDVFHVLETGDREHVALAIQFLHRALRDQRQLHERLIASYCRLGGNNGPLILDYFTAQADLPAETVEGLTAVLDRLPYFQVHLILRLLDAKGYFSERVEADVAGLLDHREFFIARRASEHLLKQPLSEDTRRKLDEFRQRHRQRL